jgi:flavin-dependent dehydrogenase
MSTDIVIIGGGPAGAAAAITARAAGLGVCLVERETASRMQPGEAAHPGIEPLLERLDVIDEVRSAGFLRHSGTFIAWPAPQRFVPFGADHNGPWRGFQLWRPAFDPILLRAAERRGVDVIKARRDVRPLSEAGRVAGITLAGRTIKARVVIDASGRQRWLARHLGLQTATAGPRMIAWFQYMGGACPPRDGAPAIIADAAGWTWTARVRPGIYQWVRMSHDGRRPPRAWSPREFVGLSPLDAPRGVDVSWSRVQPSAGGNWFLAGDAAFVLDPASSHGLLKAIMSGMAAAHHASAALLGRVPVAAATREYDRWMADWFGRDCDALRSLYRQIMPDAGSRASAA